MLPNTILFCGSIFHSLRSFNTPLVSKTNLFYYVILYIIKEERMVQQTFIPTLYYYEHCPFCVRVRTVAGLLGIELNKKILANDDEATPIAMIGTKMLPILEKAPNQFMGESLDIIEYLCETYDKPLEKNKADLVEVNTFLTDNFMPLLSLAMPRWINLGFEEFITQSDIDYFVNKKTNVVGDFTTAIAKTEEFSTELQKAISENADLFKRLTDKPNSLAAVLLFAGVWGGTCAKKMKWSDEAMQFIQTMSDISGVSALFDRAM